MVRRGFVIIVINLLLIATVVSVWALWRNQPAGADRDPAEQGRALLAAETLQALPPQQRALYERLQQRLLSNPQDFEVQLLEALLFFQSDRLDDAIALLRDLTAKPPQFQLAHLVYGDLLVARFERLEQFGG